MRKGEETIFNTHALQELAALFCGEQISRGRGRFRTVYAHRLDANLVIKIEPNGHNFSNIREMDLWEAFKGVPNIAKWLAPCIAISPGGVVLLQRRVRPVRREELPDRIPAFLNSDARHFNWGMLDGNIVCCDYGDPMVRLSMKMEPPRWGEWDELSQW